MKKILVVGIAAVALSSASALAADMPAKAAPLFDWTGWYLGLNTGYSWGRSKTTVNQPGTTTVASVKHDGWLASVEGGYCWQRGFSTLPTVTCFEVRYDFPRERGRLTIDIPGGEVNTIPEIDPLLIGPHFGILTDANRQQWYVAGGLALGPVGGKSTATDGVDFGTADPGTKWKAGWFVGVGTERMIDQHWSWKVEYDYVRLGGGGGDLTAPFTPGIRGIGLGTTASIAGKAYDNVITFGINYHFGSR